MAATCSCTRGTSRTPRPTPCRPTGASAATSPETTRRSVSKLPTVSRTGPAGACPRLGNNGSVKPWTLVAFASSLLAAATFAAERAPTQPPEFGQASKDSVWVTTPERMIRRMLQIADTSGDDVVMDLGAGDGRIPIYAAKHFGAHGIAVELEANLVQVA